MGLFKKIKSLFRRTNVEMEFDLSNIKSVQDLLDGTGGKREDLTELSKLSKEYEELTRIITDLQKLERIPKAAKKEIMEIGGQLKVAFDERKQFQEKSSRMSDKQQKYIVQNENTIKEDLKKIRELEQRQLTLKVDMNYLEGERGELEYNKQRVLSSAKLVRKFSLVSVIIIAIALVSLTIIISKGGDIIIPSSILLLFSSAAVVIIFGNRRKTELELRTISLKQNKAIQIQDKVKIKYLNTTSFLEYLYAKYHVMSYEDLIYQYQQYNNHHIEVRNYRNTSENIRNLEEKLDSKLRIFGVEQSSLLKNNMDALVASKALNELIDDYMEIRNKLKQQIESIQV